MELGKAVEDTSIALILRCGDKDRDTRVRAPDACRRLNVFCNKAGEASEDYDIKSINVDAVQRLMDISKAYAFQTWLIVMGELSDEARRYANENRVYLTDISAWQEIEQIKSDSEL